MNKMSSQLSRRNFIKLSGMTGAALAVGMYFPAGAKEPMIINAETAADQGIELNAWIRIDTSGKVTIIKRWDMTREIVTEGIDTIALDDLHRINNIADGFAHLGAGNVYKTMYEQLFG